MQRLLVVAAALVLRGVQLAAHRASAARAARQRRRRAPAGCHDCLIEARANFLVDVVNRLERLPSWKDTAVILMYDEVEGARPS